MAVGERLLTSAAAQAGRRAVVAQHIWGTQYPSLERKVAGEVAGDCSSTARRRIIVQRLDTAARQNSQPVWPFATDGRCPVYFAEAPRGHTAAYQGIHERHARPHVQAACHAHAAGDELVRWEVTRSRDQRVEDVWSLWTHLKRVAVACSARSDAAARVALLLPASSDVERFARRRMIR